MKKVFSFIFVGILAVSALFVFTACSCSQMPEEIDITASLSTKQDYLLTNVYNKPAGTNFNDEGSENFITDDNYYVTVKKDVVDILQQIVVGGLKFSEDSTVSLSVGNNNYLIRDAWKLEDGDLMIASGLLLSSTNAQGRVVVKYGSKELSLITLEDPTDIDFDIEIEGNNANIEKLADGKYTYTSSNFAGYFKINVMDDKGENLLSASSVISVEKIKKDSDGTLIGVTYALSKADKVGDEHFIIYYPDYHAGENYAPGNPADFTMEFRFLVVGIGADSFTYNFVNSAT